MEDVNMNIKIKVLGVGGGGCNMVSHLYSKYLKDYDKKENIEVISVNTDIQVLNRAKTDKQIIIGRQLTNGWGAGMKPEVGKESAIESYSEIVEALDGADMVFVASGMGGGTGTGAAAVVAQAAKEVGALTVSIVTKPFRFEGPKRTRFAEEGLRELKKTSDSLIVVDNEKLMELEEKKLPIKQAFRMVDNILANAVQGIISIVLESSENDDINVDFADLKTVLSYSGSAIISIARADGEKATVKAVENAMNNPLLENSDITGTRGILIHFTMNEETDLQEVYDSLQIVYDKANEDADIIFGTSTDPDLPLDEVRVTLIATGFKDKMDKEEEKIEEQKSEEQIEVNAKPKFRLKV